MRVMGLDVGSKTVGVAISDPLGFTAQGVEIIKIDGRWERGLGFPDIQTLEPLAQALGISVLELMRSERQETEKQDQQPEEFRYTQGEVAEMLQNAGDISRQQKKHQPGHG